MERSFPADFIPCLTCLGGANNVAEVVTDSEGTRRAYCVSGQHVCTLTPAVEEHLRQIAELAEKRRTA